MFHREQARVACVRRVAAEEGEEEERSLPGGRGGEGCVVGAMCCWRERWREVL